MKTNVLAIGSKHYGWEYDRLSNRFTLWRDWLVEGDYNTEEVTIEDFGINTPEEGVNIPPYFYSSNLLRHLTRTYAWKHTAKVRHYII